MKPSDWARPSTSSTFSKNGDAFGTVLARVAAGMPAEVLSDACGTAMLISRGMSSVVLLHGRDWDRVRWWLPHGIGPSSNAKVQRC